MKTRSKILIAIAAIVIVVLIIALGGKGKVQFTFQDPPYIVEIQGENIDGVIAKECEEVTCVVRLPKGPFAVKATKDGHFDAGGTYAVARFKTRHVSLDLRPFPYVTSETGLENRGQVVLAEEYASIPNNVDEVNWAIDLEAGKDILIDNLPEGVEEIIVSPDGSKAILDTPDKPNLLDTATGEVTELPKFDFDFTPVWSVHNNFFLVMASLREGGVRLAKQDLVTGEHLNYGIFPKNMKFGDMYLPETDRMLLALDRSVSPHVMYRVDMNFKSRSNLFEASVVEGIKYGARGSQITFNNGRGQMQYHDIRLSDSDVLTPPFKLSVDKMEWNGLGNLFVAVNSLDQFDNDKLPQLAQAVRARGGDSMIFISEYNMEQKREEVVFLEFDAAEFGIDYDDLRLYRPFGTANIYLESGDGLYLLKR